MVATVDIETFTDADFVQRYVYRTVGGVPIDFGMNVLRLMVRAQPENITVVLDRSSISESSGIIITDAAAGAFTLSIPYSMLVLLTPGIYSQSLIRTDATFQSRQDIWRGRLIHTAGPTRWNVGTF